jgi:type II protein arginine methyltransferase
MPSSPKAGLADYPAQLLSMGKRLMASGRMGDAATLVRNAVVARPDDHLIRAIAEAISTHGVPKFHSSMLRDGPRNSAYRRGIEAAAPGCTVLDIGTGSGLLAMMAARAGAEHVYACEQDVRLATTAREIIAKNGLSDKITVLHANSNQLDRDKDLGGGVNLVVSEIFDSNLLGEGVLASLRDARQRLCLPEATFLPGKASIRGALVEIESSSEKDDIDLFSDVEGFDISPFQRHLRRHRSYESGDPRLRVLSEPVDLFAFDFLRGIGLEDRTEINCISNGGRVTGILQWIAFETGPGVHYENAAQAGARSHWALRHYACETPIDTHAGDSLAIRAWRDDSSMFCWIER